MKHSCKQSFHLCSSSDHPIHAHTYIFFGSIAASSRWRSLLERVVDLAQSMVGQLLSRLRNKEDIQWTKWNCEAKTSKPSTLTY